MKEIAESDRFYIVVILEGFRVHCLYDVEVSVEVVWGTWTVGVKIPQSFLTPTRIHTHANSHYNLYMFEMIMKIQGLQEICI